MESHAAPGATANIAKCVVTHIVNPHEFYIATTVNFLFCRGNTSQCYIHIYTFTMSFN